jgi:hypothetical protein
MLRRGHVPSAAAVYDRYSVPAGLRAHMLRVAGVATIILDHWQGSSVDRGSLIRVLLLHDIGNVVKMDDPGVAAVRLRYEQRYGADDHQVSLDIGREIGLSDAELDLMSRKVFLRNDQTRDGPDCAAKIGAYADQRVAPSGVLPLLERLAEGVARYRDKPGSSMNNPRTPALIEAAAEIEAQIQRWTSIPLLSITTEQVDALAPTLLDTEF